MPSDEDTVDSPPEARARNRRSKNRSRGRRDKRHRQSAAATATAVQRPRCTSSYKELEKRMLGDDIENKQGTRAGEDVDFRGEEAH